MIDGNCPNCGAPIIAPVCDYCGTRHCGFENSSTIECTAAKTGKVLNLLQSGLVTPNEVREMLGMRRNKEISNALKGPYRINW